MALSLTDDHDAALLLADRIQGMRASREVIPFDPAHSFRWHEHDYPSPIARWNYHPEYEIHLIRSGSGRFIVGDHIGTFEAGQVTLIGSGLPHDWVSEVEPGEVITARDAVLQFDGRWVEQCIAVIPELSDAKALLAQSARGIHFSGATAAAAAPLIEAIGATVGVERVANFFALLSVLARSPTTERTLLAGEWFSPILDRLSAAMVDITLEYVFANHAGDIRMSEAARLVGISEPAFSKQFKKWTGQTFTDMVRKLRIARARYLLEQSDDPVSKICFEVGFTNLSNFNRRFMAEMGTTPTAYRRAHVRAIAQKSTTVASLAG
jgi:AraC-like DNA-binding protein/mannose-6-phosphate isomerase-like protein (cupin superfamily)